MDVTALFDLNYGVYVVAARDGERPVGCLVNTVFQITAEPMTVAVSVNKENYTESCIRKTGGFSVSVISEETPQLVIGTFGFRTSRDTDKFAERSYRMVDNLPVLEEKTTAYLICRVQKEVDMGTHTVFIASVEGAERLSQERPMTYAYYHKVKNMKTAKNAPTYVADEAIEKKAKFVCDVCGYTFEGTEEEWKALPQDWKCPICGMDKSHFKRA